MFTGTTRLCLTMMFCAPPNSNGEKTVLSKMWNLLLLEASKSCHSSFSIACLTPCPFSETGGGLPATYGFILVAFPFSSSLCIFYESVRPRRSMGKRLARRLYKFDQFWFKANVVWHSGKWLSVHLITIFFAL